MQVYLSVDLEGVALGAPERVTVGAGEWIAWPGDLAHIEGHEKAPLIVGDAGEAIAAAAAGLGRARVPMMLAKSWIDEGRVTVDGPVEEGRRGYWLVAPLPQWRQKKVKALVSFLTGE